MCGKKRFSLFIAAFAIAIFSLYGWWKTYEYIESTDNAYLQSDISTLSSQILSSVQEIKIADHMPVKIGEIIAVLDKTEFAANLAKLKAALLAEQDILTSKQQNITIQNAAILQAENDVEIADSTYLTTLKNDQRDKNLSKNNFTSKQSLDESGSHVTIAKAKLDNANYGLTIQKKKLGILTTEISMENHKLDQIRAEIIIAQKQLSNCEIISPVAGFVVNRSVEVGDVVRPGSPITSVVPSGNTYIIANFKETQIKNMCTGQKVAIEIDAMPHHKFTGVVENISPATGTTFSLIPVQNATGNFIKIVQRVPVRIKITNQKDLPQLLSGLSSTVSVDTKPL